MKKKYDMNTGLQNLMMLISLESSTNNLKVPH